MTHHPFIFPSVPQQWQPHTPPVMSESESHVSASDDNYGNRKPWTNHSTFKNTQENCSSQRWKQQTCITTWEKKTKKKHNQAETAREEEIRAAGDTRPQRVNKWFSRASLEHSLVTLHITGRANGGIETTDAAAWRKSRTLSKSLKSSTQETRFQVENIYILRSSWRATKLSYVTVELKC